MERLRSAERAQAQVVLALCSIRQGLDGLGPLAGDPGLCRHRIQDNARNGRVPVSSDLGRAPCIRSPHVLDGTRSQAQRTVTARPVCRACPLPKPCPARSMNVRRHLTSSSFGRLYEGVGVRVLRPSALPGGTRFSGRYRERARRTNGTGGVGQWRGRGADVGLRRVSNVAVMQTTDFGDRDDRAALRRLDWATVGGVLVEREMCARLMVVRESSGPGRDAGAVHRGRARDSDSRRIDPMRRSAKGFCHGLCGAVRTSSIRRPFTRCRNGSP